MKISLDNLKDPRIVTTEERFNIKDIDPPLITVCPQNQIDEDKLKSFGYSSYRAFLKGDTAKETNRNVSFWKIFDEILIPENYTLLLFSRDKGLSF